MLQWLGTSLLVIVGYNHIEEKFPNYSRMQKCIQEEKVIIVV